MGGSSKAEKASNQASAQLLSQQKQLEAQQAQEKQVQEQQLLKRRLSAIRANQGGNGFSGISDEGSTAGGLSNTLG